MSVPGATVGSASTPGQRRISVTDSGAALGSMPLHVGGRLRKVMPPARVDRERGGAGRRPIQRNPAFDLAALQFGADPLAQRGFETAQLVGQAN